MFYGSGLSMTAAQRTHFRTIISPIVDASHGGDGAFFADKIVDAMEQVRKTPFGYFFLFTDNCCTCVGSGFHIPGFSRQIPQFSSLCSDSDFRFLLMQAPAMGEVPSLSVIYLFSFQNGRNYKQTRRLKNYNAQRTRITGITVGTSIGPTDPPFRNGAGSSSIMYGSKCPLSGIGAPFARRRMTKPSSSKKISSGRKFDATVLPVVTLTRL